MRSMLSGLVHREPEPYERVSAETLDLDLLNQLQPELVEDLSKCLDTVIVKIVTDSGRYEVHHAPRTTIEFYGIHPINDPEYDAMLQMVENSVRGKAFGEPRLATIRGSDVTGRHIGLPKRLGLREVIGSINVYRAATYQEQSSQAQPIKSVSAGPANFSNMPVGLYERAKEAGLNLTVQK